MCVTVYRQCIDVMKSCLCVLAETLDYFPKFFYSFMTYWGIDSVVRMFVICCHMYAVIAC